MKELAPFLVIVALLALFTAWSIRTRRRLYAAEQKRVRAIKVGDEVMTTSGLYGTVVLRNDDDTVQLSIAPGVEVRWAVAALREIVPSY